MSVDAGMAILPVEPAWTEREPSGMESSGELAACCMQEPRSARCPALARHITALACAPHLHAISPHLLVPRTCTPYHRTCSTKCPHLSRRLPRTCTPYHRTCLCPALARHITALACPVASPALARHITALARRALASKLAAQHAQAWTASLPHSMIEPLKRP
jgi:hypothetical protein